MSKITESARGMECQIRIPGICNGNPESVVWCHANGSASGKGIGAKSHDALGAYGCQACHDVYDRRAGVRMSRLEVENAFYEGHQRSLLLLFAKGLVKLG